MRTFMINVAVFLGLFAAAYFAIPVVHGVGQVMSWISPGTDRRGERANYAGQDWARIHFQEFRALNSEYVSFLGWRREAFSGRTITVEPDLGIRHTPLAGPVAGKRVYFFGGSAMWGTGADDARTIPALYQRAAGGTVLNFGESGWIAHQSLNQLMKLYTEGHRPDVVVFYDGYNDVRYKCRTGSDFWADERQQRVRAAIAYEPREFGYYWQPLLEVAGRLGMNAGSAGAKKQVAGDCDSDPRKAHLVSEQIIADWRIAALLVASHGGTFRAFLQPVGYLGAARMEGIALSDEVRAQFRVVYGEVRKKMAGLDYAVDLSGAFDGDALIYIDDVHVSPNGNAIIAERMRRTLP